MAKVNTEIIKQLAANASGEPIAYQNARLLFNKPSSDITNPRKFHSHYEKNEFLQNVILLQKKQDSEKTNQLHRP